ncbi:MAG TPA: VIT and VWA domain-containing protein, partial [Polyangiaceae bacterium LLY-WYZ-15_(1-7)]|nr:VIT and VWA domain-containing protein [Polyangiaceae bacterium LLY-WYZ-15_(1-7)]
MDVERTPAHEADRSADVLEESATGGAPAPSSTAGSIPHAPMAQAVAAEEPTGGEGEPAPGPQSWRRATNAARFATVSLGGGHSLELRRVRVSVHVEGLRARTVVDHVFYNPHARTIEGTFRYPLPPEASVSSYAMYLGTGRAEPDFFGPNTQLPPGARVEQIQAQIDPQAWGELRVGRIVKAERGREVYEDTTRRNVDPALVEEVAPNTFEARVFPIQAQGFHRVIVSYEQTLPRLGDALEYAFPLPEEGELEAFDFQLEADASLAARARYTGDVTGVEPQQARGAHAFHYRHEGAVQGGALAFRFAAPSGPLEVLAGAHPERDEAHALFRIRGDARLPSQGAYAEDAVFLLDTSLSEHPERFQIDVALLEAILARSPGIRRFNVITFDAGARWLRGRWIDNDEDGRAEAIEALEAILLEGATDLGAALEALATPPMELGARVDAFLLSDGALSWGERDAGTLVRRYARRAGAPTRFFAYRTGLGAENADLLRRLTAGGGAVFNCLSVDSVPGCATAHHAPGFRVERVSVIGEASVEELLVAGGAATLTRGGELLVAGALKRPGRGTLRLEGTVAGAPRTLDYPVELTPRGELASRAWAEIAVAHLVASGDPELEELTVALSQHYRVPSRLTSFLVLETDAEYEQHDLAAARAERDAP